MGWCVDKGIPHHTYLSWPAESRAKLIAYLMEEALRCSLCGSAEWEWEDNKHAYDVTEKFCQGCYLKTVTADSNGGLPGTTVELVPVTPLLRAKQWQVAERLRELDTDDGSDG